MATSLWPVHPHPLPDELLSSWMIRLARGNGFKVHNFCAQFFGRERQIWNRDIDHHAPPWLINALAARSGTQLERIAQTTLRSLEASAFERFNEVGATRWILPLGVFHRTRRGYGQQFCPLCLGEDEDPYLRRIWRLGLSTVCSRHGVLLQDRCFACGHQLMPHRSDMALRSGFPEKTNMLRCYKCRAKISGPAEVMPSHDTQMQSHIETVLRDGFAVLASGQAVYSHLYFDGLRMIMRAQPTPPRSGAIFELAPIRYRLELLRMARQLTADWPDVFLAHCSRLPHAYTTVSRGEVVPYWLDSVLRRNLFFRRAPLSKEEANAIATTARRVDATAPIREVCRRLSGRDVAHLLVRHSAVGDTVVDMLIASMDREIAAARRSRGCVLLRDKVMFIAARCLRLRAPELLALRVEEIEEHSGSSFTFERRIETRADVHAMLWWYIQHVRPQFAPTDVENLFIACDGSRLGRTSLSMRFVRALKAAQLQEEIFNWTRWARIEPVDTEIQDAPLWPRVEG